MQQKSHSSHINLKIDDVYSLIHSTLIANKTSDSNAMSVANALLKAEIEGQYGHGLSRLMTYVPQVRNGKINGHAQPLAQNILPAIDRIDAQYGFAFPALDLAVELLTEKVEKLGIAAISIHKSHHFGQAAAPCEKLAKSGFLALIFGNSPTAMPIPPAKIPMLGTNPIAFAAPVKDQAPIVIDMALSTVARGKIAAAHFEGTTIPDTWAFDAKGQPTQDPAEAIKGMLQPLGGQKGALLALMVEILSSGLTDSNLSSQASSLLNDEGPPPNLGQTIIAIDVNAMSQGGYDQRIQQLKKYLKTHGSYIPGSRKASQHQRAQQQGLQVSQALYQKIKLLR